MCKISVDSVATYGTIGTSTNNNQTEYITMQKAKTGKTYVHERTSEAIDVLFDNNKSILGWESPEKGVSPMAMALAIDYFNELNSNWMHIREPEKGKKFIAIYNDDSGCVMCKRNDDGVYWANINDEPYTVNDPEWFDSCGRWVLFD